MTQGIETNSTAEQASDPGFGAIHRGMEKGRRAQAEWKSIPIAERAQKIGQVAGLIASRADELARGVTSPYRSGERETVSAELLPLAEAAFWLSRNAKRVLQPQRLGGRGLPFWLGRLSATIYREPVGMVMIVATWNYPLFLMGTQVLQAIVAGNGVCIKVAPGTMHLVQEWKRLLLESGIPSDLVLLLESDVSNFDGAIAAGIDLVVMTGSSQTGKKVLEKLAPRLIPAILELGGSDAMIVLASADVDRVIQSIRFSLCLNSSATCMAARRILIDRSIYETVCENLSKAIATIPPMVVSKEAIAKLSPFLDAAIDQGAQRLSVVRKVTPAKEPLAELPDQLDWHEPIVLRDVAPSMGLAALDTFAPLLLLTPFNNIDQAIELNNRSPYALSASLFGEVKVAEEVAKNIRAGFVSINDLIVPTADPRVPFGGRGESGFGSTRGAEGLLEMTCPKVISVRKGNWLPHLDPPEPSDKQLLFGMLRWRHGRGWMERLAGLKSILRAIRSRGRDAMDRT